MSTAGRVSAAELDAVLAPPAGVRTIAVLGASYAGHRAVQVLAPALPAGWRLVVLERNTHAPHLYAFPRMTVVAGHESKVFIPYDKLFASASHLQPPSQGGHALIQASLTALDTAAMSVTFRPLDNAGHLGDERQLSADYIVYALGSELSDPINLWAARGQAPYNGSKVDGVRFLQRAQSDIQKAETILVVGGGALGVQMAGDIAERYPTKKVTLTHSRNLLPRFDTWMHEQASKQLEALGVKLVLGSRVDLASLSDDKRSIRLQNGEELTADLILLCLGQQANTQLLPPEAVRSNGMAAVKPTLQLETCPSVFVIGDAADAFGAINAGHTAWDQATIAGENILSLIASSSSSSSSSSSTSPPSAAPVVDSAYVKSSEPTAVRLGRTENGKSKLWAASPAAAPEAPKEVTKEEKAACTCSGCDCVLAEEDGASPTVSPASTEATLPAAERQERQLKAYKATPPAIKVSLGLTHAIRQTQAGQKIAGEGGPEDLNSLNMWKRRGIPTDDVHL